MLYAWEWKWGNGPAEGCWSGEPFKTEAAALAAGRKERKECMAADRGLAAKDKTGYWAQFVRPMGELKVIPYHSPYSHVIIEDFAHM